MLCISNVRRHKVKSREDPKSKSVLIQCSPHFASGSFLHFSLFLVGRLRCPPAVGQIRECKPLGAGSRLIRHIHKFYGILIPKGSLNNMAMPNSNYPIHELRVAITTSDYERLVKFYCDGLGIEPAAIWNNGQGKALVLNMGQATLEIFDETQAEISSGR